MKSYIEFQAEMWDKENLRYLPTKEIQMRIKKTKQAYEEYVKDWKKKHPDEV